MSKKLIKEISWWIRQILVTAGFIILALEAWNVIDYPLEIMVSIIFMLLAFGKVELKEFVDG